MSTNNVRRANNPRRTLTTAPQHPRDFDTAEQVLDGKQKNLLCLVRGSLCRGGKEVGRHSRSLGQRHAQKAFPRIIDILLHFSLKDTLKVDVQNLLALRLFLKSFLSGYNTRKYVLDFPRIQSPCCVGPTCGPAISSFHPIRARHQRVYSMGQDC
jgi:hypothetical protein